MAKWILKVGFEGNKKWVELTQNLIAGFLDGLANKGILQGYTVLEPLAKQNNNYIANAQIKSCRKYSCKGYYKKHDTNCKYYTIEGLKLCEKHKA